MRKQTKSYHFTVEGETEEWYFKWLENLINNNSNSTYRVSFKCKKEKNPYKYIKSVNITQKTNIYHVSDYESDESQHVKQFQDTIDNISRANKSGKSIQYTFAYSNFTFDLWILLHKMDFLGSVSYRHQYIEKINKAYNENFLNMKDFKHEKNFKRCLKKLNLTDVITAIERSKIIMDNNKKNKKTSKYNNFEYYKDNPALLVHEPIEKILIDCGLIQKQ